MTWLTAPVLLLQESTLQRTRPRVTSMCLASAAEAALSTQTSPATPVRGVLCLEELGGWGEGRRIWRQKYLF